jgi:hypothetical protein
MPRPENVILIFKRLTIQISVMTTLIFSIYAKYILLHIKNKLQYFRTENVTVLSALPH